MSINSEINFEVLIDEFAERHFVKSFRKKYKNAWEITQRAIIAELVRVDNLIGSNDYVEIIKNNRSLYLIKVYFKIAGSQDSKKGSGNRAIVFADFEQKFCRVLIVYSKNDFCPPNETQKWQAIVKQNYPEIWDLF